MELPAHLKSLEPFTRGLGPGTEQTIRDVLTKHLGALPDTITEEAARDKARRYLAAVIQYTKEMRGVPLDLERVLTNRFIVPAVCPRDAVGAAGCALSTSVGENDIVLRDAGGRVYAEPAILATAELGAAAEADGVTAAAVEADGVTAAAVEADGVTSAAAEERPATLILRSGECLPFAQALLPRGERLPLVWLAGECPVLGAFTEGGALWLRRADGRWVRPREPLPLPAEIAPTEELVSSLKGAAGELSVFHLLTRRTSYSVKNTAHRARAADLAIEEAWGRVIIDVKDYGRPVPEKEVQKFRRDLGARGADAGVFVSLSAPIVGVKNLLTIEHEVVPLEGRRVPVVYVASRNEDVIVAAVNVAAQLAKRGGWGSARVAAPGADRVPDLVPDFEEIADRLEEARVGAGAVVGDVADRFGAIVESLGLLLRDQRAAVRALRRAADPAEDRRIPEAAGAVARIREQYPLAAEAAGVLEAVVERLHAQYQCASGGDANDSNWRFLKARAVHLPSGVTFAFLKTRAEVGRPLSDATAALLAGLMKRHPKKVRAADGAVSLELCAATAIDALELAEV